MEETNYYKAKEGYTYKRKIDGFIMGNELYLDYSLMELMM